MADRLIRKLRRLEKKRSRILKKRDKLSPQGATRKKFIKITQEADLVQEQIFVLAKSILFEENDEFRKIANENLSLFREDFFNFKVRATGGTPVGTRVSKMKGRINKNGLADCKATQTNFPIAVPGNQMQYPSKLAGNIDYLGNINLHAYQISHALLKTLPQNYVAQIKDGQIIMVIEEDKSQFSASTAYIAEIIGNPFATAEHAEKFFENRTKLVEIINELRDSLKS